MLVNLGYSHFLLLDRGVEAEVLPKVVHHPGLAPGYGIVLVGAFHQDGVVHLQTTSTDSAPDRLGEWDSTSEIDIDVVVELWVRTWDRELPDGDPVLIDKPGRWHIRHSARRQSHAGHPATEDHLLEVWPAAAG